MDFPELTPERLKAELELHGRSQSALARAINLDSSAVNRIVNGKRQIKAIELRGIFRYLVDTDRTKDDQKLNIDFAGQSKVAQTFLRAFNQASSGADTREFILSAWSNVMRNLRVWLDGQIKFADEEMRPGFLHSLRSEGDILIALARGYNIRAEIAADLVKLHNLAFKIAELPEENVVEDSEDLMKLVTEFLSVPLATPYSARAVRLALAVASSSLALRVLDNAEGDSAYINEVEELAVKALARKILSDDKN